jgi:hypothetical protein
MTKNLRSLLLGAVSLFAVASTQAVTISAIEILRDLEPGDNDVEMERSRTSGSTTKTTDDKDTIRKDNSVSSHFGKISKKEVTFSHLTSWITHGKLTSATLEITARGADATKDFVYVLDPNPETTLGWLISGSGAAVSSFKLDVADLADDIINIKVQKSSDDSIEIIQSKFTFTWEESFKPAPSVKNVPAIPDFSPTLPLLGIALVGLAFARRLYSV